MYQAIIVEDDPMVAEIEKQYVERNSNLTIAGIFHNGQEALEYIRSNPVDLIFLDCFMPVMDGVSFLSQLRTEGNLAEVIMVTAANETDYISKLYSLGISEYLIKPFNYPRFQAALNRFVRRRDLFSTAKKLNQEELDQIVSVETIRSGRFADKGIQITTLETIRSFLQTQRNEPLSVEAISKNVSLSRVTLRRYLNYLIDQDEVAGSVNYSTGGRPSAIYTYIGKL